MRDADFIAVGEKIAEIAGCTTENMCACHNWDERQKPSRLPLGKSAWWEKTYR